MSRTIAGRARSGRRALPRKFDAYGTPAAEKRHQGRGGDGPAMPQRRCLLIEHKYKWWLSARRLRPASVLRVRGCHVLSARLAPVLTPTHGAHTVHEPGQRTNSDDGIAGADANQCATTYAHAAINDRSAFDRLHPRRGAPRRAGEPIYLVAERKHADHGDRDGRTRRCSGGRCLLVPGRSARGPADRRSRHGSARRARSAAWAAPDDLLAGAIRRLRRRDTDCRGMFDVYRILRERLDSRWPGHLASCWASAYSGESSSSRR